MKSKLIAGKTLKEWIELYPEIKKISAAEEIFWCNPSLMSSSDATPETGIAIDQIIEADERLKRFAPFIAKVFPETAETGGIIESPLISIPHMQDELSGLYSCDIKGKLFLKLDSHLPIAGSIKARGGIYEVLKHTEEIALKEGILKPGDNYEKLSSDKSKKFFSRYKIQVGSTGNLGLSIGIMASAIGYRAIIHMSAEARQWKKDLLRSKGAEVIEYTSDYSNAVAQGRKVSDADPDSHFVDDENSIDLFLGYSTAALRLKMQLAESGIEVNRENPLFIYIPCGVGGGPAGVAFGIKQIFGDNAHCFFAEPTHSPCMLLGMITGEHNKVSVYDFGLDNITEADGLAVACPSGFAGKIMENLLSGVFTVSDDNLFIFLTMLTDSEKINMEPSALAGMPGPALMQKSEAGKKFLKDHHLTEKIEKGTHIIWGTGGSLVPVDIMNAYYMRGEKLLKNH